MRPTQTCATPPAAGRTSNGGAAHGRGRHPQTSRPVPPKHYLSRFERDRGAEHAPGTKQPKTEHGRSGVNT